MKSTTFKQYHNNFRVMWVCQVIELGIILNGTYMAVGSRNALLQEDFGRHGDDFNLISVKV